MIFTVNNVMTTVSEATASEDAWLRHILSDKERKRGFRGQTTGFEDRSFYIDDARAFPSGLVPLVSDMAREAGHAVSFKDNRRKPCLADPDIRLNFLQDPKRGPYQKAAIDAAVRYGRGILWCPTAFGKTQVAIGIVKTFDCPWVFLVDEGSLLTQTIDRWNDWSGEPPAGILGDSRWQESRFVVATFQSLASKSMQASGAVERWRFSVGGIITDECHVLGADSYYKTALGHFPNAYYRFGMSATPLHRGAWENLRVMACTGRVIYRADVPEMVRAGVVALPVVTMIPFQHKECLSPSWNGVYGELIVRNKRRNTMAIQAAKDGTKPVLVFCTEIAHGESLLDLARRAGLKAEFVSGKAGLKERKMVVKRVVDGDTDVLITNKIFQKGVDIPPLRTIVIVSGMSSVIDTLQRGGRGMRVQEDKSAFELIDFEDKGHDWLARHSRERKRSYKLAGYQIEKSIQEELAL